MKLKDHNWRQPIKTAWLAYYKQEIVSKSGDKLVYLQAINLSSGRHSLSNETWGVNKAKIKFIRVETDSSDWTFKLYPRSGASSTDDLPVYTVIENADGDTDIHLDYPYCDAEGSYSVHIEFSDNAGGDNTANITIIGEVMS